MADKTILDFPALTDNLDADEMYVLRGTGTGRDRHQSRLDFLQDILLFGVPVHLLTRIYPENFGMAQDEGMVWQNSLEGVNTGNKPSTNQDKWRPVSAPTKKMNVAASGAIVFGYFNPSIEVDLSGGNVSINQLPVPDFIGQKIHIYGVGSGIGDIAGGTGAYVNGVYFTENTGGVYGTAISATEWRFENGVTSDYVSSNQTIVKSSAGDMLNISLAAGLGNDTTSFTISDIVPVVSFSTISEIITGPVISKASPVTTDIVDYSSGFGAYATTRASVILTNFTNLGFFGGASFSSVFAYAFSLKVGGTY